MSQRITWQNRLEPFASQYADLVNALEAQCESLTTKELGALQSAAKRPTMTNCWWATHQVAPLVLDAIKVERYRRKHLRKIRTTRTAGIER